MLLTDRQRAALRFDQDGLIPAIVQQHDTGEVLMMAWMSAASLDATLARGETVFHSRSRQELWHKGATSGHVQPVVDIRVDCDGDALLVLVDIPADGVACHTGARSCFHRELADLGDDGGRARSVLRPGGGSEEPPGGGGGDDGGRARS